MIVRACEGHTRESFTQNELLKGAVERKFEIIGEMVEDLQTALAQIAEIATDLKKREKEG